MTLEEIYAIPTDGNGWRLLPNGKKVHLGSTIRWQGKYVEAHVGDRARVGDRAIVGDGANFYKSPLAVQGTKHLACQSAPGVISIGCQTHTFAEWKKGVTRIVLENGYTRAEAREYKAIVEFIIANGIPETSKK